MPESGGLSMGHTVQGFIAKADILRDAARGLGAARVVLLEQGFAFLPNTDDLSDEIAGGTPGGKAPHEEFYKLSSALANFGAACSDRGAVAYVETDYWGGEGEQAAVLWEGGEVIYEPERARLGPINDVLRQMGATRGDGLDQFDAVGLGRHRSNDDWIEWARSGAPA